MKLTIAIPYLNQLQDSKSAMACIRYNTSEDVEYMIIDNGSSEPIEEFFLKFVRPKRLNYIRNNENIGLVETMQQAYKANTSDILAITHNDVFIYEKDWDKRIVSYFETMPDLGAIGFFGSQGCGPIGERIQDVPNEFTMAGLSNMLEAELHGMRMIEDWRSVAIFDGFMMIFRKSMLDAGKGFDTRYMYHHLYDRDASLESLRRGYKNIVVNVPCHHLSGLTANRPFYQTWIADKMKAENADKLTHDLNTEKFKEKFKDVLPLYVNDDFTFRTEPQAQWNYQGDKILKMT